SNCWRKVRAQKGVAVPRGRRGHTALVHQGTMLVYGGYQDLRGSSNELWGFHFDTESWHMLSSASIGAMCGRSSSAGCHGDLPPARHKHSSILHDDAMWVYGGMTDLQERADFWRWDTVAKMWTSIRAKPGPGALHSHAACKLPSSMLLFGGERDGHPTNELWRFHFGTETWERLQIQGPRPQPRAESVALAVSELLLQNSVLYQNQFGDTALVTSSGISSASSHGLRSHRSRGGGSVDRCTNLNPRHSSYHPNNRVSPCEKKYVFRPMNGNYVDGSCTNGSGVNQELDYGNRRYYGGQHSSAVASTPSGQTQAANSFLREISKLSQINLSRLSHHKCSYSVLSNSSHDDSTESLLHQHCSGSEEGGEQVTPSKSTMVKSQSANIISRRRQQELCTATSPGGIDEFQEPESAVIAPVMRHHSGCSKGLPNVRKKASLTPVSDSKCGSLPRDPISVPNFGAISSLPTPVLTPVEVTRLVFVDTDDDNETEDVFTSKDSHSNEGRIVQVQPLPPFAGNVRDFSIIHQQFQPRTGDSAKRRSDSYSSHLLAAEDASAPAAVYQNVGKASGIPKSASVRFRGGQLVTELEETSDETVSTSDYASIETVNRIASASNYSVCNKPSPVDNQFLPYQQSEECGMGKYGEKNTGNIKTPSTDIQFGFCNPNYMGPDIQTILATAGPTKSRHVTTPTSNENEGTASANKQHFQTYAQLLNSPPDSVLEDASGRSISRQFYQDELMELQSLDSSCSQPPSLATTPGCQIANRSSCTERAPPQYLALRSPYSTNPMGVEKRKKSRASSASRAEKHMFGHSQDHDDEEDVSYFGTEPSVPLYMFVLGGKEQGQVTVFKRPVSVWKLQLAPNIF
ncbi:hypothetical protein Cfor_01490, partial [Coptotermes formosanus]